MRRTTSFCNMKCIDASGLIEEVEEDLFFSFPGKKLGSFKNAILV